MDFSRAGIKGREVNRYIAFFNASVQGLDKLGREATARPGAMAFRAAIIAAISAMLFMANKDDEKYKETPQYLRDLFWILPVGNSIVRIPKPFEFGVIFGTGTERFLRWQIQNDKKAFDGFAKQVFTAFTPDFIFTALQPMIEVMTNYSMFRDRPIVPQSEQQRPSKLQYGPGTSEVAKLVGGLIDVSPRKIDHLLNGYFATAGRQVRDVVDTAITIGEKNKPPERYATEITPIISAFMVTPFGSPESIQKLYKRQDELQEMKKEIDLTKKPNKEFKQSEYDRINQSVKQLSDISSNIKKIYEDKNLTSSEKRRRIDELKLREMNIAKRALGN
jgi:hypothetical protein